MAKNYYFIGIGGIGMSGLAKILISQGNVVNGSDPATNNETEALLKLGAKIDHVHKSENIDKTVDVVVATAAIPESNPELIKAAELGISIKRRPEMLNEIITQKKAIAVTGTHGKTTTSSMLSEALIAAGLDPLVTIGAEVASLGSNARTGEGEYSVAEVCEYQRAFLDIHPFAAIITNIDADHLDCYKDIDDIKDTFQKFVGQIDPSGFLCYCADDPNTVDVVSSFNGRRINYAIENTADYMAKNIQVSANETTFDVENNDKVIISIKLAVPGKHNILNALAVIATSAQLGADLEKVAYSLSLFTGAERRFQYKGTYRDAIVIDDYAHHPTEIKATLAAARSRYQDSRIIAVFQPHQHSRTKLLLNEFSKAFSDADLVLIPEIYAVRDSAEDIASVSSADIESLINKETAGKAVYFKDFPATINYLKDNAQPNDVILTIGAGPVNKIGEELIEAN